MGDEALAPIEMRSGFLWVKLPDAIRMDNSSELEEAIERQLSGTEHRVVLDFCDTVYLYSSGIGLMIRIRKTVTAKGGAIYLVNVSKKLRRFLEDMRLDKVFPIYATDVEFEISREEIWKEKSDEPGVGFLFVAQQENGIYRINMSGRLDALHDLSPLDLFQPEVQISRYLIDMRGLEVMDTYGSQTLLDFLRKIRGRGGRCATYGADGMIRELMGLLGMDDLLEHFDTEPEALENLSR